MICSKVTWRDFKTGAGNGICARLIFSLNQGSHKQKSHSYFFTRKKRCGIFIYYVQKGLWTIPLPKVTCLCYGDG